MLRQRAFFTAEAKGTAIVIIEVPTELPNRPRIETSDFSETMNACLLDAVRKLPFLGDPEGAAYSCESRSASDLTSGSGALQDRVGVDLADPPVAHALPAQRHHSPSMMLICGNLLPFCVQGRTQPP